MSEEGAPDWRAAAADCKRVRRGNRIRPAADTGSRRPAAAARPENTSGRKPAPSDSRRGRGRRKPPPPPASGTTTGGSSDRHPEADSRAGRAAAGTASGGRTFRRFRPESCSAPRRRPQRPILRSKYVTVTVAGHNTVMEHTHTQTRSLSSNLGQPALPGNRNRRRAARRRSWRFNRRGASAPKNRTMDSFLFVGPVIAKGGSSNGNPPQQLSLAGQRRDDATPTAAAAAAPTAAAAAAAAARVIPDDVAHDQHFHSAGESVCVLTENSFDSSRPPTVDCLHSASVADGTC